MKKLSKILNKQFCLWVVPAGKGEVKKVRFRLGLALLLSVTSVFLVSFLTIIASDYSRVQIARLKEGHQHSTLEAKHARLRSKAKILTSKVSDLSDIRAELEYSHEAVRERLLELDALLGGIGASGILDQNESDNEYYHEEGVLGIGGKDSDQGVGGAEVEFSSINEEKAPKAGRESLRFHKLSSDIETSRLIFKLDQMIANLRTVPIGYPGNGFINSFFGKRRSPFTGRFAKHQGVDMALPLGSYIHSTADGVIESVKRTKSYGLVIDVRHSPRVFTRYAHLSRVMVTEGEKICRGEYLGLVGSSGRSTGPHLHYEIRIDKKAIDPKPFMLLPQQVRFDTLYQ